MISPETLRRYPFFAFMNHEQLRETAMIAEEVTVDRNEVLFSIGEHASALYLLRNGSVDLHFVVVDEHLPQLRKDFLIGTINPGDIFGISALVAPYVITANAVTTVGSQLIRFDADALRELCDVDRDLAFGLQKQIAKVTMERLHATRILLAAASIPTSA